MAAIQQKTEFAPNSFGVDVSSTGLVSGCIGDWIIEDTPEITIHSVHGGTMRIEFGSLRFDPYESLRVAAMRIPRVAWEEDHYYPDTDDDPSSIFDRLATEWRRDCGLLSSVEQIAAHPSYQRIISIGTPVIPFILRDLQREPDHWFVALSEITKEDPIPSSARGRIADMAKAWIEWGKVNNHI